MFHATLTAGRLPVGLEYGEKSERERGRIGEIREGRREFHAQVRVIRQIYPNTHGLSRSNLMTVTRMDEKGYHVPVSTTGRVGGPDAEFRDSFRHIPASVSPDDDQDENPLVEQNHLQGAPHLLLQISRVVPLFVASYRADISRWNRDDIPPSRHPTNCAGEYINIQSRWGGGRKKEKNKRWPFDIMPRPREDWNSKLTKEH